MKLKDWQVRALKTFVQSFGGVFIPAIISILKDIENFQGIKAIWAVLFPILCGAIAAGISAVWNIALENFKQIQLKEEQEIQDISQATIITNNRAE